MPLLGPELLHILMSARIVDRHREFVERTEFPGNVGEEQHLQERFVHPDGDGLISDVGRTGPDRVHIVFEGMRFRSRILIADHEDSGPDVDDGPQRTVQFAVGAGGVSDRQPSVRQHSRQLSSAMERGFLIMF